MGRQGEGRLDKTPLLVGILVFLCQQQPTSHDNRSPPDSSCISPRVQAPHYHCTLEQGLVVALVTSCRLNGKAQL